MEFRKTGEFQKPEQNRYAAFDITWACGAIRNKASRVTWVGMLGLHSTSSLQATTQVLHKHAGETVVFQVWMGASGWS